MTTSTDNSKTDLLLEEYKLIQAKIDKLGEDKFKVRSWCFTLLTGGVVAMRYLGLLENSWVSLGILLLLLPAIGAFHLVELRQRQLSKRLGYRAAAIERTWRSARYGVTNRSATPQLASLLIQEGREENARYSIFTRLNVIVSDINKKLNYQDPPKSNEALKGPVHFRATPPKNKKPERPVSVRECLIVNAEDIFYCVQYFLVIAFAVFLVRAILKHDTSQKQNPSQVHLNLDESNGAKGNPSLIGESK